MRTELNMTPRETAVYNGLAAAITLAHETAENAGWYRDPKTGARIERNFGEVIALMHSELSEALEADRKSLNDDKLPHRSGVEVEVADTLIRIADTAAARGDNVPAAVVVMARVLKDFSLVEVHFALTFFKACAMAGELGIDLSGAYVEKNAFNAQRADHKLEARAAAGGKKY